MSVLRVLLLVPLLVAQSLGASPSCAPEYPINVNVLLDSWADYSWHTRNSDHKYNRTWTSAGECEDSTFSVCTPDGGEKWLESSYIDRTLSRRDAYPVRIFVNITYSVGSCPRDHGPCDEYFELLIARFSGSITGPYEKEGIMPDNKISTSSDEDSGTKQFYFDVNTNIFGFFMALRVNPRGKCVTVSRILVYNYECPGHDKQDSGLLRRPATQAPINGSANAMSYCTDNSHPFEHSNLGALRCTSEGRWINEQGHCVCDSGYEKDGDRCIEVGVVLLPKSNSTTVHRGTTSTQVPQKTTTTDQPSQPSPSGLPDNTKDTTTSKAGNEDDGGSGSQTPMVAGVVAMLVVIFVLVLVVSILVVVLVRKKKKKKEPKADEPEQQLSNPVYDAVSKNIQLKTPQCNTTGYGRGHNNPEDETLRNFRNPLYQLQQTSLNGKRSRASKNGKENHYFEDPQYSVPNGNIPPNAEYEIPVASPSLSGSPPPLPPANHVYDYARLPPEVNPEYATLEPTTAHGYHMLEVPDTGPARSAEKKTEGGREGGGGGGGGDVKLDENQYSTLRKD